MSDAAELTRRLQYERGLSVCSQALVFGGDQALPSALRAIREAVDVCRVYLFENVIHPEDGLCMRQTHEDCRAGVSVELDNPVLQHLPYRGGFQAWADALAANQPVTGVAGDFPADARDIFEAQQIKAILVLPVWVADTWWGFVGFDDTRSPRVWRQVDIDLLRTAADLIGSFLGRRAAAAELRLSEQRFKSIVESSPMGMHLYELQGETRLVLVGANPAADAILGIDHAPFLGRTIEQAFPPLTGTEIPDRYRDVARTGLPWRTTHVDYADETIRGAFDVVAFRIAPSRMVAMFLDVSERERGTRERQELERRLQHAQKLESLGVLAGGLAHDFNNLLMAVLGNLDLAQQGLSPLSPAREGIEQAMAAARRATDLTRQMLAYSGKGRFVVTRLDLNAVVRENADLLRAAVSRTVTLALDLNAGPVCFEGDPAQVQQVVMNLITNASDACGDGPGVVTLRTRVIEADEALLARSRAGWQPPPGRYAGLEIADSGCGMDDDTLQRLFDPFFTTKFTGRGLGMSAVLGIVRGHRGAILVDSAPARGTRVQVLFPFLPPAGADGGLVAPVVAESAALPPPRAVVLVVDDDPSVRRLCVTFVQRLGHEALEAEDGEAALEVFRRRPDIACVLLDLTMPRLTGVETYRELRRIRPDLRVILASGYDEQDAVQRFAGEGLAGFIQKPFRLADLKARLDRALP